MNAEQAGNLVALMMEVAMKVQRNPSNPVSEEEFGWLRERLRECFEEPPEARCPDCGIPWTDHPFKHMLSGPEGPPPAPRTCGCKEGQMHTCGQFTAPANPWHLYRAEPEGAPPIPEKMGGTLSECATVEATDLYVDQRGVFRAGDFVLNCRTRETFRVEWTEGWSENREHLRVLRGADMRPGFVMLDGDRLEIIQRPIPEKEPEAQRECPECGHSWCDHTSSGGDQIRHGCYGRYGFCACTRDCPDDTVCPGGCGWDHPLRRAAPTEKGSAAPDGFAKCECGHVAMAHQKDVGACVEYRDDKRCGCLQFRLRPPEPDFKALYLGLLGELRAAREEAKKWHQNARDWHEEAIVRANQRDALKAEVEKARASEGRWFERVNRLIQRPGMAQAWTDVCRSFEVDVPPGKAWEDSVDKVLAAVGLKRENKA